jgi:hypothetical protein
MRSLVLLLISLVALAQEPPPPPAVPLPAVFTLPADLELKPGSVAMKEFDRETFDLRPVEGKPPVPMPVVGKTWRFIVRASGPRPMGAFALLDRLLPALENGGWVIQWRERAIAKHSSGERQFWVKASAGSSGELRIALVEKSEPRVLDIPLPGAASELPKGTEDFTYLPPWPGARISASNVSRAPVDVKFPDGSEHIMMVNFIDKEYSLAKPPSDYEFLVVYREALERAGWVIEGFLKGGVTQLQATYNRRGRDLRATLRLLGDAMGISVADVGAQTATVPTGK